MLTWKEVKERWAQANKFKSDGCSGAPDLFWKDCCKEHDFYYRFPKVAKVSRREADKRLRLCMVRVGKEHVTKEWRVVSLAWVYMSAWTYWTAVRLIGWNFWNKRK